MFLFLSRQFLRDLRDALHFLTRIPVPGMASHRNMREVVAAFPLAGALLGALLALLDTVLALLHIPAPLRSALVVGIWCWLTDAMHLEGLMRAADLLALPYPRHEDEESSRVAALPGMVSAAAVLLVKVLLLASLQGAVRIEALLLAPLLGRWSLVLAAALFPSAVLDSDDRRGLTMLRLIEAALLTLALASLAGASGILALLLCSTGIWRSGRILAPHMPDHTGELYGLLVELSETIALLVCALGVTGLGLPH